MSFFALSEAHVRSRAICARSEIPRRWPRGREVVSRRGPLVSMETELLHYQLAGQRDTPTFVQQQLKDAFFGGKLCNVLMLLVRHIRVRGELS